MPIGAPAIKQVRQLYSPTASDMHFVRDMSFGRDMRYARWKKEANRISLRPAGAISLLRSKNITPSRARHITSQQLPADRTPQGVTHYTLQARRVKRSTIKNLLRFKSRICIIRHIFLLKLGYISVKKRWYTIRRNKVCGKDASRI